MKALYTSLLVLAACGDNLHPTGGDDDMPPPDAPPAPPRAVVVSGNFMPGQPGVMSSLDLEAMAVSQRVAPNGAVGDDPVLRVFGDELFVVNRADGNNVTILDKTTFALKEQLATGAGSNPQDVAVVGTKLYVPGFGTSGVVVVPRGGGASTTIDLSSLDPDGKPDCITAMAVGSDVYVACELLDQNFSARGPGKVVVIDSATDQVKTTLTLANKNPFGVFEQMPDSMGGDLVIATVPSFGDFTMGCVERVKVGATPAVNGCLVQNQDLGGYAARMTFFDVAATSIMWTVVSSFDTAPHGALRALDMNTKCLWAGNISAGTQLIVDAAACSDGTVVLADQTAAANGLRVYNGATELTTMALPIGLAPNSAHGLVCY